ncbi:nickel import ATP-binding protein NikE [Litchfieldia alkalitelluris]|uniref:nickel import ATP-binding protein NikE n=1 Tax=Litchfieldia alkalitelluris TaxID=304268 RepID=UPI0009964479|nr:nickel import ATP-binding protein NikE [Litchfieldia alkalitelluris]
MSLLQVKQVSFSYNSKKLFKGKEQTVNILNEITFDIEEGKCLGLIGTSGAGKSTLGKIILGIQRPQQGQVLFLGHDIYHPNKATKQQIRRNLQVVFQDSYSAVNPRMTAERIISEPLENYEKLTVGEQRKKVIELLERVGLNEKDLKKYPHQFSGGQLQRINIARAIALRPKLIVLDESVSSLDMVTQSLILELLSELKEEFGLSYLFITHDIKAAFSISDQIGVLEKGELIELYDSKEQFFSSKHPIVKRLRDSILAEHPRFRTLSTRGNWVNAE